MPHIRHRPAARNAPFPRGLQRLNAPPSIYRRFSLELRAILQPSEIQKCVFVLDYKHLGRQTHEEFNRFQEVRVEENTNTRLPRPLSAIGG